MVKVILGPFGAFPIFDKLSKMASRRAKQSKIWPSGVSIQCIQGTLTVNWLRSLWGYSMHFRFSTTLFLENG